MTWLYHKRETCRMCNSSQVELAVPLAQVPIATPNVGTKDRTVQETTAPLDLYLCRECGHVQILHVVNPELQYHNYLYRTSVSLGLADHFRTLADDVLTRIGPAANDLVVELGSNDGTLLRYFQQAGMRVLGVDPAQEIARQATASGVETLADFFTRDLGRRLAAERGLAKVIVANNVVANIDDLDDFADGIAALLAKDGAFVFETQDGAAVFERNLIDTVYHEHLSYFLIRPFLSFFARRDMEVVDVLKIATKGGSIRVTVQHQGGPLKPSARLAEALAEEDRKGLGDINTYRAFAQANADIKARLQALIDAELAQGHQVAGFGTSVGTITLLHQFDLMGRLSFLVDDNPFKDSLDGPGYSIPVLKPQELSQRKPAAVVILAWRYAQPIMDKYAAYGREGGKFIVPLPDVSVY